MTRSLRYLWFTLTIAAGFGLGLLYGWVISPVRYVDTSPDTLSPDYRTDYVLMTAEVYHANQDLEAVRRSLALLGIDPPVEIVGQAITFAQQAGYAQADLVLMRALQQDLQRGVPSGGGGK